MSQDKLLFTPGPVKEYPEIIATAAQQTPYFRNQAFSDLMLENEQMLLSMVNAPKGSKAIVLTASGTGAMEAVVLNLIGKQDKVLSVIAGGFGQRFADICHIHERQVSEHRPQKDDDLSDCYSLEAYSDHHVLLINGHETSICHKFNLNNVGQFCQDNGLLHIVDGITLFLTDQLDMQSQNIDALVVSSQKGLALPPGLAMVILSPNAINKVLKKPATLYFNFNDYLANGVRGQTPFTPAVAIILQLNHRLKQIERLGGVNALIQQTANNAEYFRRAISKLPLQLYSKHLPNSVTALRTESHIHASQFVTAFEEKYNMVLCPNGGELAKSVFRVSHMGNVTHSDTEQLIHALHDYFGIKL